MNEFLQNVEPMTIMLVMSVMLLINFALLLCNVIKTNRMNKRYKEFMTKLGKGDDIDEMLRKYIQDVLNVSEETQKLKKQTKEIEKSIELAKKYGEDSSKSFVNGILASIKTKNSRIISRRAIFR